MFLPREHKIRIFELMCNFFFYHMENIVDFENMALMLILVLSQLSTNPLTDLEMIMSFLFGVLVILLFGKYIYIRS